METVTATWVGPFDGELPDGPVKRGETREIKTADLASGHWQPVERPQLDKPKVAV